MTPNVALAIVDKTSNPDYARKQVIKDAYLNGVPVMDVKQLLGFAKRNGESVPYE